VLAELDQMVKEGNVRGEIVAELRAEYGVQVSEAEERIRSLHLRAAELLEEERQAARRHALVVEKDAILEAYNKGLLGHEALEKLLGDVNARLFELEDDHEPPAPAPAQSETASPEKTSAAPPDREEPPKA
jgi:hypothetical protein